MCPIDAFGEPIRILLWLIVFLLLLEISGLPVWLRRKLSGEAPKKEVDERIQELERRLHELEQRQRDAEDDPSLKS